MMLLPPNHVEERTQREAVDEVLRLGEKIVVNGSAYATNNKLVLDVILKWSAVTLILLQDCVEALWNRGVRDVDTSCVLSGALWSALTLYMHYMLHYPFVSQLACRSCKKSCPIGSLYRNYGLHLVFDDGVEGRGLATIKKHIVKSQLWTCEYDPGVYFVWMCLLTKNDVLCIWPSFVLGRMCESECGNVRQVLFRLLIDSTIRLMG